jgi:hypothetical protein
MNLILCHSSDRDAIWLHLNLRTLGIESHLIAPEQVLMAREWTQSLDDMEDDFLVETQGGLTLRSREIAFVFNRVQMIDAPIWRRTDDSEREYVRSEMTALFMSWLYQLQQQCVMINPPIGNSLSGVFWSEAQWTKAAFDAGFAGVELGGPQTGEREKVLVVGDQVISRHKDRKLAQRCIALSRLAQSPLLEIDIKDRGLIFGGGTTSPPLQVYGHDLLVLLCHQLTGKNQ